MPDPLTLIELLRAGTRAHHDRVEAVGFGKELMDGTIDLDRYRRLIAAQAGVHARLEPELLSFRTTVSGTAESPPYRYQSRGPALHRDLAALGLPLPSAPQPENTLEPYRLLARAYVLDGASLGGSAIYRALRQHRGADFTPDMMNFYAFQSRTGRQQWAALLPVLRQTRVGEEQAAEAVAEARGVFDLFAAAFTGE
ncbi:MAG: biliverdin-producing heme oxygenase [Saprospiraceae bacterium]